VDKVYTLPDLPKVPYSDLQALVCRLIEFADLSVLPALDDELRFRDRLDDLNRLRCAFADDAGRLAQEGDRTLRWKYFCHHLIQLFWFDLFGWQGVLSVLPDALRHEDELFEGAPVVAQAGPQAFQVQENLTAGQWVVRDFETVTLRPALPEEIPAQEETVNG
jgi:hypothetical protein